MDRVHRRLPRRRHLHVRHDEAPREGRQVIPLNNEPQARNTPTNRDGYNKQPVGVLRACGLLKN